MSLKFSSNSSTDPVSTATHLADQAVQSADHAIQSTQRVATEALDRLAQAVEDLRSQAAPLLDSAAGRASTLAHEGLGAVHDQSQRLRHSARDASESAVRYVQHDPVKSMLMAAAAGGVLMALVNLMRSPRDRH